MTREEKIKLLLRIENGEDANAVLNSHLTLFGIDRVYKYAGRILTAKEVRQWPGKVINFTTIEGTSTLEEELLKYNVITTATDPEPEHEHQEKQKRPRIIQAPEPVATSKDWCISYDDDDHVRGNKIGGISIRM